MCRRIKAAANVGGYKGEEGNYRREKRSGIEAQGVKRATKLDVLK
jgi:hypothetical protein